MRQGSTNALAAHLGAGGEHTCAALADGALKCWGYNDSGQLGTGDTDYRGVTPNEMGDALLPVKLFGM
jgi:alpha-tubulin suppressor-like RCC1 family protein